MGRMAILAVAIFASTTVAATAELARDDLRTRFIAAATDPSVSDGPGFSAEQAGCVFDRFSARTDDVRTLGLVLAMEGQRDGTPDVPFMIRNQASFDEAVKVCPADQ